MKKKIKVRFPVLVEGKYDKITLSSIIDANIVVLGGFSVFNSEQTRKLVRKLAEKTDVILLTDPDGGGRQIRSYILGILPKERVHQLHIPKIMGKEARKRRASRSGTLGVEGMSREIIERLFLPFATEQAEQKNPVTVIDFYRDGLSGGEGSAAKRARLAERLDLPKDLSSKALLEAINLICGREEYEAALKEIGTQS
ncbi:MAG: DUF4093 domain-containing protein [Clostridia bacterium]|nr:DUF4093 domain-containing protein [Clostridia bacterium]